jgi:hypothetical protein
MAREELLEDPAVDSIDLDVFVVVLREIIWPSDPIDM